MAVASMDRVEKLLTELNDGDDAAASLLYPLVYEQLRSLARSSEGSPPTMRYNRPRSSTKQS